MDKCSIVLPIVLNIIISFIFIVSKVTFKATIAKQGPDRVIWIPRALHEMILQFEGKPVKVTIE